MRELDGIEERRLTKSTDLQNSEPSIGEWTKVNFDTAFDRATFRSSLGLVARDSQGQVLTSHSVAHENTLSAFAAKALACLETIKLG